jgi:hypothetical protein
VNTPLGCGVTFPSQRCNYLRFGLDPNRSRIGALVHVHLFLYRLIPGASIEDSLP